MWPCKVILITELNMGSDYSSLSNLIIPDRFILSSSMTLKPSYYTYDKLKARGLSAQCDTCVYSKQVPWIHVGRE